MFAIHATHEDDANSSLLVTDTYENAVNASMVRIEETCSHLTSKLPEMREWLTSNGFVSFNDRHGYVVEYAIVILDANEWRMI